jgi:hypothetical protein
MFPPIFDTCAATAGVTALLGSNPVRLFLFGEAQQGVQLPYAVWQTVGGFPENYLGTNPDADSFSIQIDVYASSASSARATAKAIRDAIQGSANVVSWNGESRDPDTRHYRYSLTVDWIVQR